MFDINGLKSSARLNIRLIDFTHTRKLCASMTNGRTAVTLCCLVTSVAPFRPPFHQPAASLVANNYHQKRSYQDFVVVVVSVAPSGACDQITSRIRPMNANCDSPAYSESQFIK